MVGFLKKLILDFLEIRYYVFCDPQLCVKLTIRKISFCFLTYSFSLVLDFYAVLTYGSHYAYSCDHSWFLFKIVYEIDKDEKQYNDKDIEVEITLSTSINQSQLIRKHGLMEIQ